MFALPVALAAVPSFAQGEPVKAQTKTTFKIESPTMARSVRDWHPELGGKTTADKATTPPSEEMTESPATVGGPTPPPGKRSEPAKEVPLKSIRQ